MLQTILASPYANYILASYGVAGAAIVAYSIVIIMKFLQTRRRFQSAGFTNER